MGHSYPSVFLCLIIVVTGTKVYNVLVKLYKKKKEKKKSKGRSEGVQPIQNLSTIDQN